jgi:hypothetical protein
MHFELAKSDDALHAVVAGYRRHGGAVPDERFRDYFPYCEVLGLVDSAGTIVGGYAVAPGDRARCIQMMPDEPRRDARKALGALRVRELNLVWLEPRFRRTAVAALLWMHIGARVGFDRGLDRVVYTADLAKPGLLRLYRNISEGVLYEGPVDPALRSPMRFRVSWSTPARFRSLPFLYLRELGARAFPSVSRVLAAAGAW